MSFMGQGGAQPVPPPPPPQAPPPPVQDLSAERAAAAASGSRVTITPEMSKNMSPASVFEGEYGGIDPMKLRHNHDTIEKLNKAREMSEIANTGR